MTKNKKTITNGGKAVEKLEISYHGGGTVKWFNHIGKQFDSF